VLNVKNIVRNAGSIFTKPQLNRLKHSNNVFKLPLNDASIIFITPVKCNIKKTFSFLHKNQKLKNGSCIASLE